MDTNTAPVAGPNRGGFDVESNQRLTEEELNAVRSFGKPCQFADGDLVFDAGVRCDSYFLIEGQIEILEPWEDQPVCITTHVAGEFTGDASILMGRPASVKAIAKGFVKAICVDHAGIRNLLIAQSSIGDKLISAYHRRRELEENFRGLRVFGPPNHTETLAMREFFYRNGVAHSWVDMSKSESRADLKELDPDTARYPVVICAGGNVFENPKLTEIASSAGIQREFSNDLYDLVIIGSGPSGLGAAVYAASEGLRTLVLDKVGPGGQAGASSKIENYAGFPSGLSGRELALRAQLQAIKFGAEITAPCSALEIRRNSEGIHEIDTCLGTTVRTKTVVIATGVSYRQMGVEGIDRFRNKGVYYAATKVESVFCQDRPAHIVGGGNSAGQAAMFLSSIASEVNLILRGTDLTKSMSSYLSERVEANPKIKIRYQTVLDEVYGEDRLERIILKNSESGETSEEDTCGLFIFIGAKPLTSFVGEDVAVDGKGFIQTGPDVMQNKRWPLDRAPGALESSSPGLFASGDCRSGTTKRVAFAIGDGALAVTCVHDYLGTYA